MDLFGLICATLLLGGCAWTSYRLAALAVPDAPTSVRWSAAFVVGYWCLTAGFLGLAAISAFRLGIAVPLWVGAAVTTEVLFRRQHSAAALLRRDLDAARGLVRALLASSWGFALLVAGVTLVAMRAIRSLVAPPLAWDGFTYHLLKAGRWVQSGGFTPEAAPDAWGYYEFFPAFGDFPWAWAMLPVGSDLLVGLAGVLIWLSCLVASYALARALGATPGRAALAASCVAFNPAVFNFITVAHVENQLLALFLLTVLFLHRASQGPGAGNLILSAAAMGVLGGVKFVAVPLVVVAATALVLVWRTRPWHARRSWLLAGAVVAMSMLAQPYAYAWLHTGSPTYPVTVQVAGRTLFDGHPQLDAVLGQHENPYPLPPGSELVLPDLGEVLALREQYLNLGPGAALLVPLVGLGLLVAARRFPLTPAALVVSAAVVTAGVLSESVAALWVIWPNVLGRFLTVPLAATVMLAVLAPARLFAPVASATVGINLLLVIPLGWSWLDLTVVGSVLPAHAAAAMLLGIAIVSRGRRRIAALVTALLCAGVALGLSARSREVHRYEYYNDAALRRVYDAHRLQWEVMASWPVWRHLDRDPPSTVAVTAGWGWFGHNWYRYPLLGSRLQNRVVYVPIMADGAIVDYRDFDRSLTCDDQRAWLARLTAQQVDYVVLLPPDPPEAHWVRNHPAIFERVETGLDTSGEAYRIRSGALVRGNVSVAAGWCTDDVPSMTSAETSSILYGGWSSDQ